MGLHATLYDQGDLELPLAQMHVRRGQRKGGRKCKDETWFSERIVNIRPIPWDPERAPFPHPFVINKGYFQDSLSVRVDRKDGRLKSTSASEGCPPISKPVIIQPGEITARIWLSVVGCILCFIFRNLRGGRLTCRQRRRFCVTSPHSCQGTHLDRHYSTLLRKIKYAKICPSFQDTAVHNL